MLSKAYDLFVKVAIATLLVLSLWLVVNASLKQAKGHFEFGSLMDFFNTLGTLGTLVVAYLVYKNAPKWLHQKQEEDGYTLLKELVLNDYNEYYLSWFTASHKLSMLGFNLRFISHNPYDFVTLCDCDNFMSAIRDLELKPVILNHKFSNLRKLKFSVNEDIAHIHSEMLEYSYSLTLLNLRAWRKTRTLMVNEDASVEDYDNYAAEIIKISSKVTEQIANLKNLNKAMSDYSDNLNDYFTIIT